MKELSIEEKAKRYNEVVKKLKVLHDDWATTQNRAAKEIEEIFPELAESEDERIRKRIIHALHGDVLEMSEIKEAVAWLEKQGRLMKALQISNSRIAELVEEKYNLEEKLKKQGEQKTADVRTTGYWHVEDVEQKPADKIESRQEELTEFEKAVKQVMEEAIECGDTHNLKADADMLLRLVQKPAYTKEYDFYGIKFIPKFAKWDIIKDKKSGEVSTIKDFSYDTGLYTHTYGQFPITIQDNYEIIAQNSFWSKEDVEMSRFIGNAITVDDASIYLESKGIQVIDAHVWLEELKYRVQPHPRREWSKEDKVMLDEIIDFFENGTVKLQHDLSLYASWLKSLRPQNRWKPSEGQLECLGYAIEKAEKDWSPLKNNRIYLTLKALKEQLEKL